MSRVHVVFDERAEVVEYELRPSCAERAREAARVWRAVMLAPALEACEALLRGETVPDERLDQEWVERFGVKS